MKHFFLFLLLSSTVLHPANGQKVKSFWWRTDRSEHDAKPSEKAISDANVHIELTQYFPYCGGAYPTDEQMNNYLPYTGNVLLIDLESGKKQTVTVSSEGILHLSLLPGRYALKETFKDCSYEEFLEKNPMPQENSDMQYDPDCYKNWWASNFMEFTVTEVQPLLKLSHTFYNGCFTGNNPCLIYTGPYPP